jgi:hypothetical protein
MRSQKKETKLLLEIALEGQPFDEASTRSRIEELLREVDPNLVISGMRPCGDRVDVAIVTKRAWEKAKRKGPAALAQLTPWGAYPELYDDCPLCSDMRGAAFESIN